MSAVQCEECWNYSTHLGSIANMTCIQNRLRFIIKGTLWLTYTQNNVVTIDHTVYTDIKRLDILYVLSINLKHVYIQT